MDLDSGPARGSFQFRKNSCMQRSAPPPKPNLTSVQVINAMFEVVSTLEPEVVPESLFVISLAKLLCQLLPADRVDLLPALQALNKMTGSCEQCACNPNEVKSSAPVTVYDTFLGN